MEDLEYFYPSLSRIQCEEKLQQNRKNGTFLVRKSESNRLNYVLVVNWDGKTHHYKIMYNENGFYLEHAAGATVYSFQTLDDLITHYKTNTMTASNNEYILIEPVSEDNDCLDLDDEDSDFDLSDTEDENITPFFQQQLNVIKGFRNDKAFREYLESYVNKKAIKDFHVITSGGCKAPFLQELLVDTAAELQLALQNYLKRLEIMHQLFDFGSSVVEENRKDSMAQDKDSPKDLESIFKMLSKSKNSVLSLEEKALQAFKDFQDGKSSSKILLDNKNEESAENLNDVVDGKPPQKHVEPLPLARINPAKKNKQFEVTSGPLKSKSYINIDVVNGQIIFVKNANDKADLGASFSVDKILQLIKPKTSKFKLKLVVKNTASKSYNFESYMSRELFCQTIQQLKIAHSNEPTSAELSIYVGTWNMGASNAGKDISSWFKCIGSGKTNISELTHRPADVYAFGTQESAYHEKEWVNRLKNDLQKTYNMEFRQVISSSLWGIRIVIFVRVELANLINTVKQSSVKTGIANALGNKGAIGVSFNIGTTSFCFVNAHLTSGTERLLRRNQNYLDILRGLGLGQEDGFDITLSFHHIFWMGDLNYRLELKEEDIPMIIKKRMQSEFHVLLEYDQLINEMKDKHVFIDFQEEELQFAPTYKYTKGSRLMYDWKKEKRTEIRINVPSWCDRVLWRSYPELPSCNTTYGCCDDITTSDHSPVFSTFKVGVLSQKISNTTSIANSDHLGKSTKLVFCRVTAKISTRSASKFVIVIHSNCIEKAIVSRKNTMDNFQNQMESLMRRGVANETSERHHCYPFWTMDDIPPVCPALSDPNYLEDQHLLIAVKGEDGQESYEKPIIELPYPFVRNHSEVLNPHPSRNSVSWNSELIRCCFIGECVVSFKLFLMKGEKTIDCNLTHLGLATGSLRITVELKTPSEFIYQPSQETSIYSLIKIEDDESGDGIIQRMQSISMDRSSTDRSQFPKDLKQNLISIPLVDRSSIQQVEPAEKIVEHKVPPTPGTNVERKALLTSGTKHTPNTSASTEKRRSMGLDNFALTKAFDEPKTKGMSLPMQARKSTLPANLPSTLNRRTIEEFPQSASFPEGISSVQPQVPAHKSNRNSKIQDDVSNNNNLESSRPELPPKRKVNASLSSESSQNSPSTPPAATSPLFDTRSLQHQFGSVSDESPSSPTCSSPLLQGNQPIPKPRLKKKEKHPTSLYQWLQRIHYSKYYEVLSSNGFDDLDFFYGLTVVDLKNIGIPEEDCVNIIRHTKNLRKPSKLKGSVPV